MKLTGNLIVHKIIFEVSWGGGCKRTFVVEERENALVVTLFPPHRGEDHLQKFQTLMMHRVTSILPQRPQAEIGEAPIMNMITLQDYRYAACEILTYKIRTARKEARAIIRKQRK